MEIHPLSLEEIPMGILGQEIIRAEKPQQQEGLNALGPADLRDLRLRLENLQDLKEIQRIILVEEDRALSLDEVLSRILGFYRRFVPYR
ncbi:MAG: hypothetical protein JSV18_01525 [Candidatus Bathyarchaeota archaeon]|nr:MAG: hypothetical protein JSV18_01525 [Candidatus Bathyarchaeota archaeon]